MCREHVTLAPSYRSVHRPSIWSVIQQTCFVGATLCRGWRSSSFACQALTISRSSRSRALFNVCSNSYMESAWEWLCHVGISADMGEVFLPTSIFCKRPNRCFVVLRPIQSHAQGMQARCTFFFTCPSLAWTLAGNSPSTHRLVWRLMICMFDNIVLFILSMVWILTTPAGRYPNPFVDITIRVSRKREICIWSCSYLFLAVTLFQACEEWFDIREACFHIWREATYMPAEHDSISRDSFSGPTASLPCLESLSSEPGSESSHPGSLFSCPEDRSNLKQAVLRLSICFSWLDVFQADEYVESKHVMFMLGFGECLG